jgi:hypothetical protein
MNCWICTCRSHRRREGDVCEAVHIEGKFRDQIDIQVESSTPLMNHVYFAGSNQMFIRASCEVQKWYSDQQCAAKESWLVLSRGLQTFQLLEERFGGCWWWQTILVRGE